MESDSHKHSCPQDTSGPEGPTGVCDSCPVAAETSKLLEELRRARQEAISASIAKSQFLANMSHEIRTPLNAINGLVRLLEDTPVTEEQRRLLSGLGSSSDGLLAIVNDILDFSKIEAGLLELSENEFSPRELVRKALEAFEYKAEEKSITLKLKYDDRIADHLLGDCVRLEVSGPQLVLEAGLEDRWLLGNLEPEEAAAAAEAFQAARCNAGGLQFLAVQSSEQQQGFDGFWILRDLPDG